MKKIFSFFRLENIKHELLIIQKRFPLPFLVTLVFTILLFVLLHGNLPQETEELIGRGLFSCIIMFFLSTGLVLMLEEKQIPILRKHIISSLGIVFGVFFFFTFRFDTQDFQNFMYFPISLFGILAFLFFAPYITELQKQELSQKKYYGYFYRVSIVFLLAMILGGVLFGLGAIAIGAVTLLFDIGYPEYPNIDKFYGDWAILSLGLFTPVFALTQLPRKKESEAFEIHSFFAFLIKFVATPFIFFYFAILYAYTIKVLLNFGDWPKGEVSWLVIGFSTFGYLIYIFSYIFEKDIQAIRIFRKYFPYAVLPQIAMLFYAIYLRIAQYDITTNRYFVVVFGIWLLCISLYYVLSAKKLLAFIPAVITLFTLLISVGPWSVYQLPESRQMARLEKNLTLAGILKNNEIIIPERASDIEAKLSGEIYEGISYVCGWNNCDALKELFPLQYAEILQKHKEDFGKNNASTPKNTIPEPEYSEPNSWEIVSELTQKLKVQQYYPNGNSESAYISYSKDYNENIFPLEVSGYDMILQVQSSKGVSTKNEIVYDAAGQKLSLMLGETTLDTFSLKDFFTELQKNYTGLYNDQIPQKDLTFEVSGSLYEGKLLIETMQLNNPNYAGDDLEYGWENISGYILLKKK